MSSVTKYYEENLRKFVGELVLHARHLVSELGVELSAENGNSILLPAREFTARLFETGQSSDELELFYRGLLRGFTIFLHQSGVRETRIQDFITRYNKKCDELREEIFGYDR